MPELPEVETVRRQIEPRLTGRTIVSSWTFGTSKFEDAPLAGATEVTGVRRRGKYLLVDLRRGSGTPEELIIHLGMTGRLAVTSTPPTSTDESMRPRRHLRAAWGFDDGSHLGFWDQRRFGRVAVVPRGDHAGLPTLCQLGPEPFSEQFTARGLRDGLRGTRAIKTVLLDQRLVAGIGNIYADEALWAAGIAPTVRRLAPARAESLHDAILDVLTQGLADGGTTLRDYRDAQGAPGSHQERLRCYGRAGLPCDRCGAPLERKVVDARGTTWCPTCQS